MGLASDTHFGCGPPCTAKSTRVVASKGRRARGSPRAADAHDRALGRLRGSRLTSWPSEQVVRAVLASLGRNDRRAAQKQAVAVKGSALPTNCQPNVKFRFKAKEDHMSAKQSPRSVWISDGSIPQHARSWAHRSGTGHACGTARGGFDLQALGHDCRGVAETRTECAFSSRLKKLNSPNSFVRSSRLEGPVRIQLSGFKLRSFDRASTGVR
jgi:hypothetical protein